MKYSIIYADPPWKYSQRANLNTRFRGGAMTHYQVMSISEICALPVADIAGENSALLMWCTYPQLPDQIRVLAAWGFRYATVAFTWVKTNQRTAGRLWIHPVRDVSFGVGYYSKSNAEICILGIRGKMKPASNSVSNIIIAPRREHSRKPDEARDKIVQLFGDLPRVELFARQKAPGWDAWGNQVESTVSGGILI